MSRGTFRFGTIAGIVIQVHYTWVFAFALIAWTLAVNVFPDAFPGWNSGTYWLTGASAALALFASVLIHELAHSMVALAKGMPVRSITLFIFGGVSNIGGDARSAGDEFQIAIVGPLSSLGLAAVFFFFVRAGIGGDSSPTHAIFSYLVIVNLAVGLFNLLPGFPLDGGRVLRSIIWRATGSVGRATNSAALVGMGFGWLLVGLGVLEAIFFSPVGGIWTAFIGWFLKDAAASVRRGGRARAAGVLAETVRVRDVMSGPGATVRPDTSIASLVDDVMVPRGIRAVPVTVSGQTVGIVTLDDVRRVPREAWGDTPVAETMTPGPLVTVRPDDALLDAIRLIGAQGVNQVLVFDGEALVGMVSRADVMRLVQRGGASRAGA